MQIADAFSITPIRALLGLVAVAYLVSLARIVRPPGEPVVRPTRRLGLIGFLVGVVGPFGGATFGSTAAILRLSSPVEDRLLPGTVIIGSALLDLIYSFVYPPDVNFGIGFDALTLGVMVGAAVAGAVFGATSVSRLPERSIRIALGVSLIAAALVGVVGRSAIVPFREDGFALRGIPLMAAALGAFPLGGLLTLGFPFYLPFLSILALVGLGTSPAYGIAGAAFAIALPVASIRFMQQRAFDRDGVVGLVAGGLAGGALGALIRRTDVFLPLGPIALVPSIVAIVTLLTALSLLKAARSDITRQPGRLDRLRTVFGNLIQRSEAVDSTAAAYVREAGVERWFALAVMVFAIRMLFVSTPFVSFESFMSLSSSVTTLGFVAPVVAVLAIALRKQTRRVVATAVAFGLLGVLAPISGIYTTMMWLSVGAASWSSVSASLAEALATVPPVLAGIVAAYIAIRGESWVDLRTTVVPLAAAALIVGDAAVVRQFTNAAAMGTPPTGVAGAISHMLLRRAGLDSLPAEGPLIAAPALDTATTVDTAMAVDSLPPPDEVYFEFQVERRVAVVDGSTPPRYPEVLRVANIEGSVLAQFVVDTSGHADMESFKVLTSTHDLFTDAVKAALPEIRFEAAELGGRKVKQLVQMPFDFTLKR